MASFPSPPVDLPAHHPGSANAQRVYRLAADETVVLNTMIMSAVGRGDITEVRNLLKNVLSVSTRGVGSTPLHIAAERGDVRIAQELLRVGYDVNVADHAGMTPLRLALQHGHLDLARLLQEAGGGISPQAVMNPVTEDELDALTSSMISNMGGGISSAPVAPLQMNAHDNRGTQSLFGVPHSPTNDDLSALMSLEQQLDTVRIAGSGPGAPNGPGSSGHH
ncbi:ankyrin repeat-containing domain protein [Thamnocephalis sphaerospora]|uniref:Ankyrin repeat-containing domain protein n=1 Tax=Thamnocephalis sphaerospora TaxID=78915 RepID=A0A4P9XI95_9FUNG|nr:ankyrin repeat-containing domain protein [Thamnocephalis sphaerospora]|eukprot:RKP05403.1 ankyrin repeat-containing domain protein [Thamnocephalis sphaerospora]